MMLPDDGLVRSRGPVAVRTAELTVLTALHNLAEYDVTRVYLLWRDVPVAMVDIHNHGRDVSPMHLLDEAVHRCTPAIAQQIQRASVPGAMRRAGLDANVPVSVVVATIDRPDRLQRCLASLAAQCSPRSVEIVVVDNNPASELSAPVAHRFPQVKLVTEHRRGLSYARNAGIVASEGAIIVTIDDDVVVPSGWLESLVAPFEDPSVAAVTGNVLPLQLETPAQRLFEAYGGLGRGFERRVVDREWLRRTRSAAPTWTLGATANAAFRASVFADPAVGLLEEALGAGMPAGVGEDTYLFYRILKAGHRLVYHPAAYVWHEHRQTMPEFRRQLFDYSRGHVAYHLTTLLRDGDARVLARFVELAAYDARRCLRWLRKTLFGRPCYPLSLVLLETWGHALGPLAYWQSRRRVRRYGRSAPYVTNRRS